MADLIFADTNLFLRYLTNDVPDQAEAVERLLKEAREGKITLATSALVIAEIVWTLESYYNRTKSDIQAKVLAILNTPGLLVADGEILLQAIIWYVDKNIDFIDAYNSTWMRDQEINTVATFDKAHFARFAELDVIVPGE